MTDEPQFHHVRIHNPTGEPIGRNMRVELDGKPLKGVTNLTVNAGVESLTSVTFTFLANVDLDVPAELSRPADPEVRDVARLAPLQPGDTVVFEAAGHLTHADGRHIEDYLRARFPGHEVVVLAGGTLKVSGAFPAAGTVSLDGKALHEAIVPHAERYRRSLGIRVGWL